MLCLISAAHYYSAKELFWHIFTASHQSSQQVARSFCSANYFIIGCIKGFTVSYCVKKTKKTKHVAQGCSRCESSILDRDSDLFFFFFLVTSNIVGIFLMMLAWLAGVGCSRLATGSCQSMAFPQRMARWRRPISCSEMLLWLIRSC